MQYNPDIHHRRSIRLRGFDYSQAGAYFVTICVKNRECLFGNMVGGKVQMNDIGRVVQTVWEELPERYPGVGTDALIVIPNHVHGIVVFMDPVGVGLALPNQNITPNKQGAACLPAGRQAAPLRWGMSFIRLNPCLRLVQTVGWGVQDNPFGNVIITNTSSEPKTI